MKFQDFITLLRAEVGNFEDMWINNNAEDPQGWEMEMGLADWWEQFTIANEGDA